MTVLFALAVALFPLGGASPGTCVDKPALGDMLPQGAGRTFSARHTIFARDYAYTKWYEYENGGGEILWHRRGAKWCVVPLQNSTYLDQPTMVHLGVPPGDAKAFRLEAAEYLQAIVISRRREPTSKSDGD